METTIELSSATDGFIDRIEREMLAQIEAVPESRLEIQPVHRFLRKGENGYGVYAREITVPEGSLITGKIHKTDHLNIISRGCMTVWDDSGFMKTFVAGDAFISPAGARRFGYAHSITVWTTIHATNETDLGKLEEELIVKMDPPLTLNEQKNELH